MKILNFGMILNQPYEITQELKRRGFEADYALLDDYNQKWIVEGWDENLNISSKKYSLIEAAKFGFKSILKYDVIHFHVNPSFLPISKKWQYFFDLPLLRLCGKKVFVTFWGCDIRKKSVQAKYLGNMCNGCAPYSRYTCDEGYIDRMIKSSSRWCNAMFTIGELIVQEPRMFWTDQIIDTTKWKFPTEIPEEFFVERTADLMVYHTPLNREYRGDDKGTVYIKNAICRSQQEGYSIELMDVPDHPHKDAIYYQAQSDICIEQLRLGWHGLTALECMALGKPVISHLRWDALEACPRTKNGNWKKIPIMNASISSIDDILDEICENMQFFKSSFDSRLEKGKQRDYVVNYHDSVPVVDNLLKYYEEF